jgi:hypothetical protein
MAEMSEDRAEEDTKPISAARAAQNIVHTGLGKAMWRPHWIERNGALHLDREGHRLVIAMSK